MLFLYILYLLLSVLSCSRTGKKKEKKRVNQMKILHLCEENSSALSRFFMFLILIVQDIESSFFSSVLHLKSKVILPTVFKFQHQKPQNV